MGIQQFIKISKYAGMREDLVQAGGGNSSVKLSDDRMLIKASGYQLADVSADKGYAIVNQKVIVDFFANTKLEKITKEDEKKLLEAAYIEGDRPSIETFLHSITDTVTLHTHSTIVNVITSRENGMDILKTLFPNALMVKYATPGIELAKEYFASYQKYCQIETEKICNVVFLQNHGLIVSSNSAENVIRMTEEVISKLAHYLGVNTERCENTTKIYNALSIINTNMDGIVYLANDRNIYEAIEKMGDQLWNHAICPDCIVYCGKKILILQDNFTNTDIIRHVEQFGEVAVIYYRHNVYIVASSVKKAKEIESSLSFSAQVAVLNINVDLNFLSEEEQNFLLNWDSEKYRKTMK